MIFKIPIFWRGRLNLLLILAGWLILNHSWADDLAKTEEKVNPKPPEVEEEKEAPEAKPTEEAPVPETTEEADSEVEQTAGEEEPPEKKLPETFKEIYLDQLQKIISKLEEHYPAVLEKLTAEDRHQLIQEFVKSFNSGIHYHPQPLPDDSQEKSPIEAKDKPLPGVLIAENKVFYLRIDVFTPKTVNQLLEDCESSARLAKKPVGIIIDLRNCQGNNYKQMLRGLSLFCSTEKLPVLDEVDEPKQVFDLPTIVIIGKNTQGAGEVFAALISTAKQGLTIGRTTAGKLFPKKVIAINDQAHMIIPEVPEILVDTPARAVKPAIRVNNSQQIPYEKLSDTKGSEKTDPCLVKAVDLLISLNAIKQQWK